MQQEKFDSEGVKETEAELGGGEAASVGDKWGNPTHSSKHKKVGFMLLCYRLRKMAYSTASICDPRNERASSRFSTLRRKMFTQSGFQ